MGILLEYQWFQIYQESKEIKYFIDICTSGLSGNSKNIDKISKSLISADFYIIWILSILWISWIFWVFWFFQESDENHKSTSQPWSARTTYSEFFLKILSQPVNHRLRAIHIFFLAKIPRNILSQPVNHVLRAIYILFFLEFLTKSNFFILSEIFFSKSTSQPRFARHIHFFFSKFPKKCNIFTLSQPINHFACHIHFFFFGIQTVRSTTSALAELYKVLYTALILSTIFSYIVVSFNSSFFSILETEVY